ncbi:MAG TPA: hypothetical protein VGC65_05505 [Bacteroidia bacterium]|jgi:hypothetical protein
MNSSPTSTLLLFLILLIPFAIIWVLAFNYVKKQIKTALNYSVLALLSLAALIVYQTLSLLIADAASNGSVNSLFAATSFTTIMLCYSLMIPVFLITAILAIRYLAKR